MPQDALPIKELLKFFKVINPETGRVTTAQTIMQGLQDHGYVTYVRGFNNVPAHWRIPALGLKYGMNSPETPSKPLWYIETFANMLKSCDFLVR